ncbi:MAG TPA: hypothetical protein DCM71_06450, partial [Runella sp.]|nr:hypothetical protein [Runella sp.]
YHFGIETVLAKTGFGTLAAALNRTILELKRKQVLVFNPALPSFKSYHFGIETTFCRSASILFRYFKSYHFGIETIAKGPKRPHEKAFKSYHFGIEEQFDLRRRGCLEKQKVP